MGETPSAKGGNMVIKIEKVTDEVKSLLKMKRDFDDELYQIAMEVSI